MTETDQANAYLDGSPIAVPLALAPDLRSIIGYFAGPDFLVPGVAAVVHGVATVTIEIVTVTETLRFDGGLISVVA